MNAEDRDQVIRQAWHVKPDTEMAATFDTRMGERLGCSRFTVGRRRRKMRLSTPDRETPPHVLGARLETT